MIHSVSDPNIAGNNQANEVLEVSNPVDSATTGVWSRSKNYISSVYSSTVNGVVSGSMTALRVPVIRNNFDKFNQENIKKLNELSGSEHFSQLIVILSPYYRKFVKVIIED